MKALPKDKADKVIGRRILELRTREGWTQMALGIRTGLTPSAISDIENGKRTIEVSTARKFVNAFGVDLGTLLGDGK